MKSLSAFLICWAMALLPLWGQGLLSLAGSPPSAGAFTPDLFSENCEGTGTPSGWTNTSTPNWDYTTSPGQGAESIFLSNSGQGSTYDFSGQTTVEGFCLFKVTTLPGSASTVFGIRDAASSIMALFRVNATGQISVFSNGSDSTATVDTISAGTWYKGWLRFVSGGTCTAAFVVAGSGARPTSGNAFASKTGNSGTATKFVLTGGAAGSHVFDTMMGSTTTIPDNP